MAGKRRAKHIFEKHTDSSRIKCPKKSAKKRFLFTLISCPKNGGKKAGNNFSINTLIVRAKNGGKKIVGKSTKKRFILTQYS